MPSSALPHPDPPSFPTRRSSDLRYGETARDLRQFASAAFPQPVRQHQATGRHCAQSDHCSASRDSTRLIRHIRLRRECGSHGHNARSEEHTSELQSHHDLVCRLLLSRTQIHPPSLHDALPISGTVKLRATFDNSQAQLFPNQFVNIKLLVDTARNQIIVPQAAIQRGSSGTFVFVVNADHTVTMRDRKSTRLNSSHITISYAVFCSPAPRSTLLPYTTLFRSQVR